MLWIHVQTLTSSRKKDNYVLPIKRLSRCVWVARLKLSCRSCPPHLLSLWKSSPSKSMRLHRQNLAELFSVICSNTTNIRKSYRLYLQNISAFTTSATQTTETLAQVTITLPFWVSLSLYSLQSTQQPEGAFKTKNALFLPHSKPSPLTGFSSHSEQKLNASGGLQSYQNCLSHLVFSSSPPFIPTTAAMQGSLFLGALAVGLTPDFWLLHFLTSLCFKSSSPNSSPGICKAHLLRSSFSTPRSPLSCVGICLFCSTL